MAQSFGIHEEWDGSPPAKVFQFLRKFAKACDYNDISEGEALYIGMSLPDQNPGRESTLAGIVARWVIGPRCAWTRTHAYMTDWL